MQIDYAKKRLMAVLKGDPVAESTYVVAEMGDVSGGLNPRKNPRRVASSCGLSSILAAFVQSGGIIVASRRGICLSQQDHAAGQGGGDRA